MLCYHFFLKIFRNMIAFVFRAFEMANETRITAYTAILNC